MLGPWLSVAHPNNYYKHNHVYCGHIHGIPGHYIYHNEPYKVRSCQKNVVIKVKKLHHLRSPKFLFYLYQLSAKFGPKLIVENQTKNDSVFL